MAMTTATRIRLLRLIGLAEALSFIALGIAMVFKYGMGQPIGVKIAGPIHGGLFLLYLMALVRAWISARWSFTRVFLLFLAALLPCGPFFCERWLRRQEAAADGIPTDS
jgi:integral membrane protein